MVDARKIGTHTLKLIIPAAGSGTRLGRLTVDVAKPLIDAGNGMSTIANIVVDALETGITDIVIVCRPADVEQMRRELCPDEKEMADWVAGKRGAYLKSYPKIWGQAKITLVEQLPNHGKGDLAALIAAQPYVENHPFIVAFGDGLFPENAIRQTALKFLGAPNIPLIAMATVLPEEVVNFGVAKHTCGVVGGIVSIQGFVEKPPVTQAPSTEVAVGVYALPANIVKEFSKITPGNDGEIRLADVFTREIKNAKPVNGYIIEGPWLDTGNHGVLAVTRLFMGLNDPQIKESLEGALSSLGYAKR